VSIHKKFVILGGGEAIGAPFGRSFLHPLPGHDVSRMLSGDGAARGRRQLAQTDGMRACRTGGKLSVPNHRGDRGRIPGANGRSAGMLIGRRTQGHRLRGGNRLRPGCGNGRKSGIGISLQNGRSSKNEIHAEAPLGRSNYGSAGARPISAVRAAKERKRAPSAVHRAQKKKTSQIVGQKKMGRAGRAGGPHLGCWRQLHKNHRSLRRALHWPWRIFKAGNGPNSPPGWGLGRVCEVGRAPILLANSGWDTGRRRRCRIRWGGTVARRSERLGADWRAVLA